MDNFAWNPEQLGLSDHRLLLLSRESFMESPCKALRAALLLAYLKDDGTRVDDDDEKFLFTFIRSWIERIHVVVVRNLNVEVIEAEAVLEDDRPGDDAACNFCSDDYHKRALELWVYCAVLVPLHSSVILCAQGALLPSSIRVQGFAQAVLDERHVKAEAGGHHQVKGVETSHLLPTMSTEQAGLKETEVMRKLQERNQQLFQVDLGSRTGVTMRQRWKDENPRGSGNKKLTPCGAHACEHAQAGNLDIAGCVFKQKPPGPPGHLTRLRI
ncbi:PP2A regulatory subunit TAP46-like [Selaginella moellendorffii]|uniref:PP2A regulatory subunit TAP46-like n=1 Tax=Selaginella moellendorffii TaxID=88036 RepID=UPI000D1CA43F|nr:PP2A regulatory subunit TAP46-like [Selaginella moellendorffii]|eukprot:XP_024529664.1 PP2A regulatory subunit TAP46-like [Selaginella moellendorffii]